MEWIYTTASTVAEAETKALDLLGVDPDDAEIQVMEEGKTGLFGRVKAEARVRARIKPKAPAVKDERRQRRDDGRNRGRNRGKGQGGQGGRGGEGRNRKRDDRKDRSDNGGNSGGKSGGKGNNRERDNDGGKGRRDGAKVEAAAGAKGSSDGGSGSGGDGRKRRRRGGGGSGGDGGAKGSSSGGGSRKSRDDRSSEDRIEMPIDEQRETLQAFVAGVATTFDPDAEVELVVEDTTLSAQVTGKDLGRLIGNKAQTLQTLEELARTAMHRAADGRRYHRIQVDVDNYRGRRRDALVKFATELAESVADEGVSKAMEPMGAADRKLVHDAVAQVDGVETVSEGRDPRRYIVIMPVGGGASDEEE